MHMLDWSSFITGPLRRRPGAAFAQSQEHEASSKFEP